MSSATPATSPTPARPRLPLPPRWRPFEWLIELALLGCGLLSIFITMAIAATVLYNSAEFFEDREYDHLAADADAKGEPPPRERVSLRYFLTGTEWSAGFKNARYGILPLLVGTLMVALIAAALALPIGLTSAIYLSEYAGPRFRGLVKPALELLAGIPTVVYGYFALTAVTPFLASQYLYCYFFSVYNIFHIPGIGEPNNQLSGGIVVGGIL